VSGEDQIAGLRVVIFGASSGIGRALASELSDRGARVAVCARRVERLADLSATAAIRCDVTESEECASAVETAADRLGGIDAVVYAVGLSQLTPLDRPCTDEWQAIFETNIFGAVHVVHAALPHLTVPGSQGRALFLTSDSADLGYPGLVAYSASKSALSRFCQGLAAEFPTLRVSEVVVGPTAGTDVADHFDAAELERWLTVWFEGGYIRYQMQSPADVATQIIEALLAEVPPGRVMATGPAEAGPALDQQALSQEN
jgi:NAD(P)-dependent dehydrogenase (short-subunit alcohol dehydrogenase family)